MAEISSEGLALHYRGKRALSQRLQQLKQFQAALSSICALPDVNGASSGVLRAAFGLTKQLKLTLKYD